VSPSIPATGGRSPWLRLVYVLVRNGHWQMSGRTSEARRRTPVEAIEHNTMRLEDQAVKDKRAAARSASRRRERSVSPLG